MYSGLFFLLCLSSLPNAFSFAKWRCSPSTHLLIPAAIWVRAGGRGEEGGNPLAEEEDLLLLQAGLQPRRVCASPVLGRRTCYAGRRCPGKGRVVCRPLLLLPSHLPLQRGDLLPVSVLLPLQRGKGKGASWGRCVISLGGGGWESR